MTQHYDRKPAKWVKRGHNARGDLGEESKARALARSRAKCQINPLIARTDGLLIDGYRTIWGLELEGMLDVELDFILTDEDLTPDQIRTMQANSAFHRESLAHFDIALVMRDTLAANPGMTRKQMAEEVFDIDPSLVSRYLALFDCIPDVLEAAKAGKLGVTDWYAIHKSKDQLAKLGSKLGGATRDELERQVRKEREGTQEPKERTTRIRIPLVASEGGAAASGTVTVAGPPGEEIGFEEALDILQGAVKAVREAQKRGWGLKAAQASWKDTASAS